MRTLTLSLILSLFIISGCGDTTTSRSLSTAGIGAVAGGAIGAMTGGSFGSSAAIGAGVGLVGGYLYDQHEKGNID